jgi:hypothetical protein
MQPPFRAGHHGPVSVPFTLLHSNYLCNYPFDVYALGGHRVPEGRAWLGSPFHHPGQGGLTTGSCPALRWSLTTFLGIVLEDQDVKCPDQGLGSPFLGEGGNRSLGCIRSGIQHPRPFEGPSGLAGKGQARAREVQPSMVWKFQGAGGPGWMRAVSAHPCLPLLPPYSSQGHLAPCASPVPTPGPWELCPSPGLLGLTPASPTHSTPSPTRSLLGRGV